MVCLTKQDIEEKSVLECLHSIIHKKHKFSYLQKEEATKMHIINPILRILGWDIENPDIVKIEYNRIDYVLISKNGLEIPIEAKGLGTSIYRHWKGGPKKQLKKFCISNNYNYGILTDGNSWTLYENSEEFEKIWSIDIKDNLKEGQGSKSFIFKLGMISYEHIDKLVSGNFNMKNTTFLNFEDLYLEKPNLEKRVDKINTKLGKWGEYLNEKSCQYYLINPILRGLGWNTRDPEIVIPEVRLYIYEKNVSLRKYSPKQPDYILKPYDCYQGGNLILEAKGLDPKGLDKNLDDKEKQLGVYCLISGAEYGILSNGIEWRVYKIRNKVSNNFKGEMTEIMEIDIRNYGKKSSSEDIINKLEKISRKKSKSNFKELSRENPKKDRKKIEVDLEEKENRFGSIFINGEEIICFNQYEIITETAEWLVDKWELTKETKINTKHLGKNNRGDKDIINPNPNVIEKGRESNSAHRLSNGLYIDKNMSLDYKIKRAKQLLDYFNYSKEDWWIIENEIKSE